MLVGSILPTWLSKGASEEVMFTLRNTKPQGKREK
jgi:hypothetical protein